MVHYCSCSRIVLSVLGIVAMSSFPLDTVNTQTYPNHFGTGNAIGVTVSSSPSQGVDSISQTLNGTGHYPDLVGASRFLAQAGFGGTYEEIEYVTEIGVDAWVDEQMQIPFSPYYEEYLETFAEVRALIEAVHPDPDLERSRDYMDFVFWDKVFRADDMLRNKAAFALNQIFVVSTRSIRLKGKGYGASHYYDLLYEGAFGNFRDILFEVSTHPLMGYYLSSFQNRKGNPELGTLPDENYAREVMQLFTIGLYELNNDGTYKLDNEGHKIPTYDIVDVQELAKVFTGFSGGAWDIEAFPQFEGRPLAFANTFSRYDLTVPMFMWEEHHDYGAKVMVDGSIIPAEQAGMQDVNDALDVLFNHPNVGPFIATRLIQQMVKSNPSPDYVNRVASAFNNNGQGVRGDLGAVFRAILLDPEARDCEWIDHPKTGKLRQPLERFMTLCRVFDVDSPSGRLWMSDAGLLFDGVEQTFMGAPTVFNFFTPFYAEDDYVAPNDMVSPAFQILHSVTAINYLNWMEDAIKERPFRNFTRVNPNNPRLNSSNGDSPYLDFSDEISLLETEGLEALLDHLDLMLCHGQLHDSTKDIIHNALSQLVMAGNITAEEIVESAIYFVVVSADYTILK